MKYFAIIDGEKRGPFELEELPKAGVRPSTYVWCKGMADWEKAEDVAEICRLYRGRLYDLLHPVIPAPEFPRNPSAIGPDNGPAAPSRFDRHLDEALPSIEEIEARRDVTKPPKNLIPTAIFITLLCNPIIGIFAIIFAFNSRQCWKRVEDMEREGVKRDSEELLEKRKTAHNMSRMAMMMIGMGFFLGLMIYGLVMFKYLS